MRGPDTDEAPATRPDADAKREADAQAAYQAQHDERFDRMFERSSKRLLAAAPIDGDTCVLDIGCGTGQSTRAAAVVATDCRVVGIDSSAAMIEKARRRADEAGQSHIEFILGDASAYPFEPAAFDVAISQFGVMFFDDPAAAFANIAAALVPGAPFVFLCWQAITYNEYRMIHHRAFSTVTDVPMPERGEPGPYSLSEPPRVIELLKRGGFDDITFEDVHEQLMIGTDAEDALRFVVEAPQVASALAALPPKDAERVVSEFRKSFVFRETARGVWIGSAAWLVRARKA